jgi:hypothetical protein
MGKKPEPPASDVPARKVMISKTPVAEPPPIEIDRVEISTADIGKSLPEEAVRIGAYLRWDAAGRPGGDGVRFWLEAEQELLGDRAPVADKSLQKK